MATVVVQEPEPGTAELILDLGSTPEVSVDSNNAETTITITITTWESGKAAGIVRSRIG
jgi:hypothetical protein